VSSATATLAGLIAGLLAGVLLALAITRFDPHVRRPSDLAAPGTPLFDSDNGGVGRLRVDLEVSGLGDGGVVTFSPVEGDDPLGLAVAVARAFAASGSSVVVIDVGPFDDDRPGLRNLLESDEVGEDDLPLLDAGDGVMLVPPGRSDVPDEELMSAAALRRVTEAAGRRFGVVILAAAPFADHPESLLALEMAEVAVVTVRPRTRWSRLESAVAQVRRARRPLRIAFQRTPSARAVGQPVRAEQPDAAGVGS
jgi:hypothetical protein